METIAIARAPVYISLGGDVDDLVDHRQVSGVPTIGATINYYAYAILTTGYPDGVQINLGGDQVYRRGPARGVPEADGALGLVEAVVHHLNVQHGQRIFVASQLPLGMGSGVPASIVIAAVKVIAFQCGLDLDARAVADLACSIEGHKPRACPRQHELYAAALGGISSIACSQAGVTVEPLRLPADARRALGKRLLLLSKARPAPVPVPPAEPSAGARQDDKERADVSKSLQALTVEMHRELQRGNLEAFGLLLHRCWLERDRVSPVSQMHSECYEIALESGALGGKSIAASGDSFLLAYCPDGLQEAVTEAVAAVGWRVWPMAFDDDGVQVMRAVPWSWSTAMLGSSFVQQASLSLETTAQRQMSGMR